VVGRSLAFSLVRAWGGMVGLVVGWCVLWVGRVGRGRMNLLLYMGVRV
jgi:hypothetical protein